MKFSLALPSWLLKLPISLVLATGKSVANGGHFQRVTFSTADHVERYSALSKRRNSRGNKSSSTNRRIPETHRPIRNGTNSTKFCSSVCFGKETRAPTGLALVREPLTFYTSPKIKHDSELHTLTTQHKTNNNVTFGITRRIIFQLKIK